MRACPGVLQARHRRVPRAGRRGEADGPEGSANKNMNKHNINYYI